jgi:hypothetical protein
MARIKTPPFFLPVLFALALVSRADAASLTVAWDPPTDGVTVGYIVVYGTSPGDYTTRVDVGFVNERLFDGLADGTTYYFGVQAYSSSGELSFLATVEGTTPTGTLTEGTETTTKTKGGGKGKDKPKGKPTATVTDDQYIDVAWEPESADLALGAAATAPVGYRVEVGTSFGDTSYSALTAANRLSFDMTDLPADKYFIRIRPVRSSAGGLTFGHVTDEAVVVPGRSIRPVTRGNPRDAASSCATAPGAPRQLSPKAQGNAVTLNWKPGAWDAPAAYFLQVGSSPGQQNVLTAQFPGNVTGVSAMAGNAAYALRMSAVNPCGSSLWAPEAMLYVGVEPLPGMVLQLTQEVSSGGLVTLTWEPPATGGTVTRYLIEAATPFGPFAYDTGTTVTGFSNPNTPPGQYLVTVRAGNATGFGVATTPIVVTVP